MCTIWDELKKLPSQFGHSAVPMKMIDLYRSGLRNSVQTATETAQVCFQLGIGKAFFIPSASWELVYMVYVDKMEYAGLRVH